MPCNTATSTLDLIERNSCFTLSRPIIPINVSRAALAIPIFFIFSHSSWALPSGIGSGVHDFSPSGNAPGIFLVAFAAAAAFIASVRALVSFRA